MKDTLFYQIPDLRVIARTSRSEVFCKKVAVENFIKFTGKQLWQSLFFHF